MPALVKIAHLAARVTLFSFLAAPLLLGVVPLCAAPLKPAAVVRHFDDTLLTAMGGASPDFSHRVGASGL